MVLESLETMSAIKTVAKTFGVLVGLAGIEHGILEMLQGNIRPEGWIFDAIGPSQRIWEYSSEVALTIIPNLLLSGILAIIMGAAVTMWAARYARAKIGGELIYLTS